MNLLKEENFNKQHNGEQIRLFTLKNRNGCVAQFTNYGARWVSMWVPDRNGMLADVLLGFEDIDSYMNADEKYYGAVVGRVAGRINQGRFSLDGKQYQLSQNDLFGKPEKNHLHGGPGGFSFRVWNGNTSVNDRGEEVLCLDILSKHAEEGYPGNLHVKIWYTLEHDNNMRIEYQATTDVATIVNLTSHAYFNLQGTADTTILDHELTVFANKSLECDDELLPTGRVTEVRETPVDFIKPVSIGSRLQQSVPGQLLAGRGYAVCYILNKAHDGLLHAATVWEKETGRRMEVYTDQPCLQFYSAWLLNGTDVGKKGQRHICSCGLALETHGYPDAPNQPGFAPIVLKPGDEYRHCTVYRFSVA